MGAWATAWERLVPKVGFGGPSLRAGDWPQLAGVSQGPQGVWREPTGPWPHRVAFREGRRGEWWQVAGAGVAGRRQWEQMVGAGPMRPREAGIEGAWSGCGGLRMCDRDRGGAGQGLGVWSLSRPCGAPERPSTHPELASPGPTPRGPLQQPEQEGVCFLFVGNACKSSGQQNKITKRKKPHKTQPTPKVRSLAGSGRGDLDQVSLSLPLSD